LRIILAAFLVASFASSADQVPRQNPFPEAKIKTVAFGSLSFMITARILLGL